jgi:membrane protease YdiL (CAAX protease family)
MMKTTAIGPCMKTNSFLDAARTGRNEFWRYILTIFLSLGLLILGTSFVSFAVFAIFRVTDLAALSPAVQMVVLLLPFGFLILGLWIGLRNLHGRPFASLLHPGGGFRWGSLFLSAGLWLALNIAGDLIVRQLQPDNYHFSHDPAAFWPYAVVILLLIPVQVLAEESYFRGYLTQGFGLAGGFFSAWLVPAVLFGLLHGVNPEAAEYGLIYTLPIYVGSGLLLGWITLRSGGLEKALGLHFANNIYGTLLVAPAISALSGPSLYKQDYSGPTGLVVFVFTALVYLLIDFSIYRVRSQQSWRSTQ